MSRFSTLCALALIAVSSATVHGKSVTFYADGAIIEQEAVAQKGILVIPLPSAMIDGSLRIKPASGAVIQRVDILPAQADPGKSGKELNALLEQKNRLGDRLQALAIREGIFKSAAKSQSGKAPRKTKTNPEPMQSIRQGTEFAIAQLEAVYTARRKTEQEIKRLDSRIAAAKGNQRGGENVVRVVMSPPHGKISVRYAVGGQGWTPRYDIYLSGSGSAQVNLSGNLPGAFAGYLLQASPAAMANSTIVQVFPVKPGTDANLARYTLPASKERFGTGALSTFSFELNNPESTHLPSGEANIYHNGEYVGKVRFEGISSGRSRKLSFGM